MNNFFSFLIDKKEEIVRLLLQHMYLTLGAILISVLIGIPLGILITKSKPCRKPILNFINLVQAIPSMALLGLFIPILGIGTVPAITTVVLYSLLPIIKNTYVGLTSIDPNILEASHGMGLTGSQTLRLIQFPLALPIIMSGIRISAVTAVGLMTLAAFIGAGGLGYLVFSGIQTVNNFMILAGAIPCCVLALLIDFIFSKIELAVTPKGISKTPKKSISKPLKIVSIIILISFLFLMVSNIIKPKKDTIVVGSKNFSEQLILGNMFADLIEEYTDLRVDRKLNLGGSSVIMSAMQAKEVDIYPDYTGTLLMNVLKKPIIGDKDLAYSETRKLMNTKYNIDLLPLLGFSNNWSLAMTPKIAEQYNIESISDLAKVSKDLTLCCTLEFANREDGLKGLEKKYGIKFKDIKPMDGSLRYSAIEENNCQVIDATSTEGLLKAFNLKVLKDNKDFFTNTYGIPVIREDTVKKHPELKKILNKLSDTISEDTMQTLNHKVDKLHEAPEKVAKEYLISKKLLKK
ncbi:glycine betaine ABC transporter substrate-binding protein [Hathewaya limosa]|uniref:Osmoprotectant transport system permease protein n=1 Tax=Hathewaya limosa TaxID=1536 RepID=A0ABU0JTQ3_HATLI|nr:glycine betaine ABC transporter substrate-binding protein [Hathewaya limosa]MDQ0480486.1 osmoprotectant transport system permease protein [Hathewaya limosa]